MPESCTASSVQSRLIGGMEGTDGRMAVEVPTLPDQLHEPLGFFPAVGR